MRMDSTVGRKKRRTNIPICLKSHNNKQIYLKGVQILKIRERLISLVTTLVLCLSVLPSTGFAAEDFIIQNGVLTGYIGPGGSVIIPDGVDAIGDEVFSHCTSLTSVTIPGSVTEIGFEAFYACTNLTNVTISNGVSTIGHSAFALCTSLASINIPDSVTQIDQYAFWACSSLTKVTVGNGLLSIGYKAFADCTSLNNIAIPAGVTISSNAFSNTHIEEIGGTPTGAGMIAMLPSPPPKVIIPEDISQVEYWSRHNAENWSLPQSKDSIFQQIKSLVKQLTDGRNSETEKAKAIYNWVSSNIAYDWEDYKGGQSTSKGDAFYVFYFRTGVCGGYAILSHFMLTIAGLPVAYIAGDAGGPHAWNAVYADGRWIEFDATWGMWDMPPSYHSSIDNISLRNDIFLEIIRNDGSIDHQMWNLHDYPSEITVPDGVTDVTFIDMDGLTSVTLPNGMTEIGTCAFEKCTNLTRVIVPTSVTKIGYRAFAYCSGLTSIPISSGVTEIGGEAFSNCTGLTNMTFPDNVTKIGNAAFSYCTNLTSVTIPASVTKIDMSAFYSCTNLKSVVIANGNAEIGELAFSKYYSPGGYLPLRGLTVYSTAGGKVENYCKETGIHFVAIVAGFTDIPDTSSNAWFVEAANWAVARGITTGSGDNTFSPDNTCTNAQILVFLYRAYGEPEPTVTNPFINLAGSEYYYKAALWAYQNGMVPGSTFKADIPCTRSMTVTYLWQAAGSPSPTTVASFSDVPADAFYAKAVAWAVERGITNGINATTFSPDATCTRSQIVTFLYRDRVD